MVACESSDGWQFYVMKKDNLLRNKVLLKYNSRCAYCGCLLDMGNLTLDHITPRFRGSKDSELEKYNKIRGKNTIANYNPCCKSCNSSKSTFTLEKWRNEIFLKFERLKRDSSSYNLLLRFNLIEEKKDNVLFYFETL